MTHLENLTYVENKEAEEERRLSIDFRRDTNTNF